MIKYILTKYVVNETFGPFKDYEELDDFINKFADTCDWINKSAVNDVEELCNECGFHLSYLYDPRQLLDSDDVE